MSKTVKNPFPLRVYVLTGGVKQEVKKMANYILKGEKVLWKSKAG